jgi:PKD repeat protein
MYRQIVLSTPSPVELTLTDPQGRRLGYNPSGSEWREIPKGIYTQDSTLGFKYLIVNNPVIGNYSVAVTGIEKSKYTLMANFRDDTLAPNIFIVSDTINEKQTQTKSFTVPRTSAEVPAPPSVQVRSDLVARVGTAVQFTGSFTDPNPNDTHQVSWDFGDGSKAANTLTPTHTYTRPGSYTVTLTVKDSTGFAVSKTLKVNVSGVLPTRTPNATPTATRSK